MQSSWSCFGLLERPEEVVAIYRQRGACMPSKKYLQGASSVPIERPQPQAVADIFHESPYSGFPPHPLCANSNTGDGSCMRYTVFAVSNINEPSLQPSNRDSGRISCRRQRRCIRLSGKEMITHKATSDATPRWIVDNGDIYTSTDQVIEALTSKIVHSSAP